MSLLGQASGYNKMRKEVKDKTINISDKENNTSC